ncbi:MAG: DUF932 domain-containing protein [Planctomycetes bacterium]|nr:DUF932 domain-containing protein [Planctomycetota bacterium]
MQASTIDFDKKPAILGARLSQMIETGRDQARAVFANLRAYPPTDALTHIGRGGQVSIDHIQGTTEVRISDTTTGGEWSRIHPNAMGQLGQMLDLPGGHLRAELTSGEEWRVAAACDYLRAHLTLTASKRVLIRTASGNGGMDVRAILSDRYRRIDSALLAATFGHAINAGGLVPYQASDDGLAWSIGAVSPRAFIIDLPDGSQDHVAPVIRLSNSDFGTGATTLSIGLLRTLCANGLVGEIAHRAVHLGSAIPDDVELGADTIQAESQAQSLVLRDRVAAACDPAKIEKIIAKLRKAATQTIEKPMDYVDALSKARRITQAQGEQVKDILLKRDPEQVPSGAITRYTVAQAVSYLAHGTEAVNDRGNLEALALALV